MVPASPLNQGSLWRRSSYAALLLPLIMLIATMAFSAPKASAVTDLYYAHFCPEQGSWMWLDPAWTGIYRCDGADSVSGYNRDEIMLTTYERAGCVDYADVWHNLITSWVCFPKETPYGTIIARKDGGWYRGVIRNNNLSYSARFAGIIGHN
jgi:hypothetical protein